MTDQVIQLVNPVSDHFETFIAANAIRWQTRAIVDLELIVPPESFVTITDEFAACRPSFAYSQSPAFHEAVDQHLAPRYVVQQDSAKGQHLVICGAGPSLREHAAEWCPQADQVWGCNSALTWLVSQGHKATHGFTVDQTPAMCAEWATVPDVSYLLASTVHPHLTELLEGQERPITFFHNFVGLRKPPVKWADENGVMESMLYEDWLYAVLYPATIRAGAGLNAVTRAIEVAQFMGFEKITILGADCCVRFTGTPPKNLALRSPAYIKWLKKHTTMHADGGHALASGATAVTMFGRIDSGTPGDEIREGQGRTWMTKPDLAVSAIWLVKMAQKDPRITLIGDTYPNAIMGKTDEYLRRLPNFVDQNGNVANIPV